MNNKFDLSIKEYDHNNFKINKSLQTKIMGNYIHKIATKQLRKIEEELQKAMYHLKITEEDIKEYGYITYPNDNLYPQVYKYKDKKLLTIYKPEYLNNVDNGKFESRIKIKKNYLF